MPIAAMFAVTLSVRSESLLQYVHAVEQEGSLCASSGGDVEAARCLFCCGRPHLAQQTLLQLPCIRNKQINTFAQWFKLSRGYENSALSGSLRRNRICPDENLFIHRRQNKRVEEKNQCVRNAVRNLLQTTARSGTVYATNSRSINFIHSRHSHMKHAIFRLS